MAAASVPPVSLADECEIDDESAKCRELEDNLKQLDALIAKGPDSSPLREAARRMLRELEDHYDQGPFRKPE